MPGGRPSKYTEQVADEICNRLSLGESLIKICKDEHMPHRDSVRQWLIDRPEFSAKYARAREDQQDFYQEEILEIADDGRNDWMTKNFAGEETLVVNNEAVQRSRLRVDTRKWIMSKLSPKKYGDKIQQEISGKDGEPLLPSITINLKSRGN